MRCAVAAFCVVTIMALAVDVVRADSDEMVFPTNGDNGGNWHGLGDNFNSPTATTDGAVWKKVSSAAPVLNVDQFSFQLFAQAANGSYLKTTLYHKNDDGSYSVVDPMVPNLYAGGYPGYFEINQSVWLPAGNLAGAVGNRHFRIKAWTGAYDSFEAAAAGGAYCGINDFWNGTTVMPYIPPTLTQMSALVLRQTLLGDANLDGTVDITDLSKVLTNYDRTGLQWPEGDFDGNGLVDVADLSKVLTNYNKSVTATGAGTNAVPEPSTLLLAVVATIGVLACRWRPRG